MAGFCNLVCILQPSLCGRAQLCAKCELIGCMGVPKMVPLGARVSAIAGWDEAF